MAKRLFKRISRAELNFRRLKTADRCEVYAGLLSIAELKGFQLGWVAHKYRAIFDEWPPDDAHTVKPAAPSDELTAWLSRESANYRNRLKREDEKIAAENAMRLLRIETILAEIEAADRESNGAYRQESDGEALEVVTRIVTDLESRLIEPQTEAAE